VQQPRRYLLEDLPDDVGQSVGSADLLARPDSSKDVGSRRDGIMAPHITEETLLLFSLNDASA
jgi:hypothetical protein